jgi:hypothetical protein
MRRPPTSAGTTRLGKDAAVRWCFRLSAAALLLTLAAGCTRPWFRNSADEEVAGILAEKAVDPAWAVPDHYVYPHPLARFADPTNPDFPPMPPDDPAAWLLSPKPQKAKQIVYLEGDGYYQLMTSWDVENRARLKAAGREIKPVEKPAEQPGPHELPLPRLVDGVPRRTEPYVIDFEQAVELGFIISREFQTRRENLYLAALPVTLQRFAFAPQFEATTEWIREWAGRNSSVGSRNRWVGQSTLGVSKLFSTGALLILQVANETIINLTGNQPHTFSQSTFLLDLAQPLLRGGGRAVTLEPLTQAERNLLYEMRDYARFHKEFLVSMAAGEQITISGTGGFAGVDLSIRGQARPVGYYPTLLRQAQVEHQERNVQELSREFLRYQRLATGPSGISDLQVGRVEQDYRNAQSALLQRRVAYSDNVDQFKIQMGLPTDTPLMLDTTPIQELRVQMERLNVVISGYTELITQVRNLETDPEASTKLRRIIEEVFTKSELVKGTDFPRKLQAYWRDWISRAASYDQGPAVAAEIGAALAQAPLLPTPAAPGYLLAFRPSSYILALEGLRLRRQAIDLELDAYEIKGTQPPAELLAELADVSLRYNLGILELRLREFEWFSKRLEETAFSPSHLASVVGQLLSPLPDPIGIAASVFPYQPFDRARARQLRADRFRPIVLYYALILAEARNERMLALEKSWPTLPRTTLNGIDLMGVGEERGQRLAGQVALDSRLDLMNRRAELADAWRNVAVFANSLLGTFDVRYNLEIQTPGTPAKPLDFEGSRGRSQLIFNAELPLVRVLERNNYRASLIAFQRARRNLMAEEDQVLFQVRQTLRNLRRLEEDYKIKKRSLVLAYLQVNQARETLVADPDPSRPTEPANLTESLLNALRSVPRAEDELTESWISYTTERMQLYRDLELMRIDSRGVWIDEFASSDSADPNRPRNR